MIDIFDVFRYNQRIQFVFDMQSIDHTGSSFVLEGGSIDNTVVEPSKDIVKKDDEFPSRFEGKWWFNDE